MFKAIIILLSALGNEVEVHVPYHSQVHGSCDQAIERGLKNMADPRQRYTILSTNCVEVETWT